MLYEWQVRLGLFMLILSLLPLGMMQYTKRSIGVKLSVWKWVLCIFLFEFSFLPYIIVLLYKGVLDLIYFLLIWVIFFIARLKLSNQFTVAVCVLLGLMLMVPFSLMVTISDGHITFDSHYVYSFIDLASKHSLFNLIMHDLYAMVWTIFPLLGVHYLMKSMENKPNNNQMQSVYSK